MVQIILVLLHLVQALIIGTIPVNRFAIPFNSGLTTAGAMTFGAAMNFGTPSSLSLGGDATIPAGVVLNFAMTGIQYAFRYWSQVAGIRNVAGISGRWI